MQCGRSLLCAGKAKRLHGETHDVTVRQRAVMTLMRAIIVALALASITPALAETLICSTWQGIRTCSGPDGYVSHESTSNGITTGDDNQGNRWTTSRWRDIETTTSGATTGRRPDHPR
jgi:hypothetical protein